jgi:septal ring factor EnvC (AmiA/AmiB activator)
MAAWSAKACSSRPVGQARALSRWLFPGLREIGILLIIGHGDSDMSLSGGNEPLFEQVCGAIRTRGQNAPAADSGEDPDSGLYFGTRLAGWPFDPITWVSVQ